VVSSALVGPQSGQVKKTERVGSVNKLLHISFIDTMQRYDDLLPYEIVNASYEAGGWWMGVYSQLLLLCSLRSASTPQHAGAAVLPALLLCA
jgi:hypothetical protein